MTWQFEYIVFLTDLIFAFRSQFHSQLLLGFEPRNLCNFIFLRLFFKKIQFLIIYILRNFGNLCCFLLFLSFIVHLKYHFLFVQFPFLKSTLSSLIKFLFLRRLVVLLGYFALLSVFFPIKCHRTLGTFTIVEQYSFFSHVQTIIKNIII